LSKSGLDIEPEGAVYIYSSSEAPGEEQEIDMHRLWEWLKHFGMEVHGFRIDEVRRPHFEKGLHASGHASPEDLFLISREISPKMLMPVHTENPGFHAENLKGDPLDVLILCVRSPLNLNG